MVLPPRPRPPFRLHQVRENIVDSGQVPFAPRLSDLARSYSSPPTRSPDNSLTRSRAMPTLCATTHPAAAIAQLIQNAVQPTRTLGLAATAGSQISSVNRLTMPASHHAATRRPTPVSSPSPQA